jgi:hypothetical protein
MPEHGIATAEDGFQLDIQLNDRAGDAWLITRDPLISVPLRDAAAMSPWGLPTVVPEVLLVFKARTCAAATGSTPGPAPSPRPATARLAAGPVSRMGHPWMSELSGDGGVK